MCDDAFSSKSVSKKMRPVVPTRDLAEAAGALVGGGVRTHELLAFGGADVDCTPAFELDLEVADDVPLDLQRERRSHRSLDTSRIGRGEHLLGRHVRDVLDAARLV